MKKKGRHNNHAALPKRQRQPRDSSPIKPSPNRETLTYAEAQRMVELEVDGRVHRLSIYDKLDVIKDDDPTAQEILECNSNKENNEKPQQVLVRSVRLKNNQQKKNAALTAALGGGTGTGGTTGTGGNHQGSGGGGGGKGGSAKLLEPKFRTVEHNLPGVPRRALAYYKYTEQTADELDEEVEYDMDEEDFAWLELINDKRRSEGVSQVSCNLFEFLMDRFEKESHAATLGQSPDAQSLVDEDAVCCVCMDGDGADSNVILFCDSCNIAVHQECYGVPYIPEGQWLCRHCLQCPSRPADCVFCPNRGGALKKTDDDRWGHVACALWVPEVGFSDTVFVEPIDGVSNIPPARWKLTCCLCKEKGAGACIQCHKQNCYTAFHVSCAQKAGLYMKMEPVREAVAAEESGSFTVKKTAYCCAHTPEGCDRRPLTVYEDDDDGDAARSPKPPPARRHTTRGEKRGSERLKGGWQKKRCKREEEPEPEPEEAPASGSGGPSITASSLDTILNQVSVQRKRPFVERVLSFWVLKRQSRNNVPLIRRLQASNPQPQKTKQPPQQQQQQQQPVSPVMKPNTSTLPVVEKAPPPVAPPVAPPPQPECRAEESNQALKEQLKEWHRLRHDLERARLLLELIRKREKLKREEMKLQQSVLEVQLTPFNIMLRALLNQLQEKDTYRIFTQPVSIKEVPDYLDHVKKPMDFSTMRRRIDEHGYGSLEEFEADFDLIIFNCMKYNAKDTFFNRAGLRMQDHGGAILRKARREAERIGFDFPSGLHLPEPPKPEAPRPFSWEDVDKLLNPANRQHMSLEDQLRELLEKLDLSTAMKHSPSRSKRLKLLKKTIMEVRGEISLRMRRQRLLLTAQATTTTQPPKQEPEPSLLHTEEEPEEKPLPQKSTTDHCSPEKEDKLLPRPPKLEPLTLPPHAEEPVSNSEPPPPPPPELKPVLKSSRADRNHKTGVSGDSEPKTATTTSAPRETTPNGHIPPPDSLLSSSSSSDNDLLGVVATSSVLAEAPDTPPPPSSSSRNRRTNILFRKSKSVSPLKPRKILETASLPGSPTSLGAKTFLSVVIPRLETLLLPKKRTRSTSGDHEDEEDEEEESPIKRLDTGLANGFVVKDSKPASSRPLEPRRRCASESSISSSGSVQSSTSTVVMPKSGKGRPAVTRRSTVDDKSALVTCTENGEVTKAAKIASDHGSQNATEDGGASSSTQRSPAPTASSGRSQGRRADAVQVRREALPRPLLRQQAQLAMAS